MTTIKLPPMMSHPECHTYVWTDAEKAAIRARDLEVARLVLEAAAKFTEQLPCDCCWPEGSDSVAEEFAVAIRNLEFKHE